MSSASQHLLESVRRFQHHRARPGLFHGFMRKISRVRWMWWSFVTQSDIEPRATLGRRLMLPHPNGVVIHEDAVIGDDCMIMQQVTIGMIGTGEVPTIGNRVYIGAGAKIIGKITVGDDARIGANAVVTTDVPPFCTAVGVPARILTQNHTAKKRGNRK